MRATRDAAALAVALAMTAAGPASGERPPAGQAVDVTREIVLQPQVAPPCIAVRASGASILVSRKRLEAMVAAKPRQWASESERLALIQGNRASALLGLAGAPGGPGGCAPVDAARLGDAAHVVVDLLEAGGAAVLGDGATTPDRTISVHYFGLRAGPSSGRGEIRFLRGEPKRVVFAVSWWAS